MTWHDYSIAVAGATFVCGLVPQAIKGFREKKQGISLLTSVPTTIALALLTYTFYDMGLSYSTCVNAASTTLWGTILGQSIRYRKKKSLDGAELGRGEEGFD